MRSSADPPAKPSDHAAATEMTIFVLESAGVEKLKHYLHYKVYYSIPRLKRLFVMVSYFGTRRAGSATGVPSVIEIRCGLRQFEVVLRGFALGYLRSTLN